MLKRLFVISIISFCLVGFVATNVAAKCQLILGKMVCSELCLDHFLKGVGNPDVKAVAVCGGIYIDTVSGLCWNQPCNATTAKGTSFHPSIPITGAANVTAQMVDENGNAVAKICWDGTPLEVLGGPVYEWLGDMGCFLPDACPTSYTPTCDQYCEGKGICRNANWWFDPCSVKIDVIYVYYSAYQAASPGSSTLLPIGQICNRCVPNPTGECGYACTDVKVGECETRNMVLECSRCINDPYSSCWVSSSAP